MISQPDRLICFAVDDHHAAWYEMVVPFILSLRQTDYGGHLAVIGYGLSERKHHILAAQGVTVFDRRFPAALPCGRYLEAAAIIADHPGLATLALYDADLWFNASRFDLFDHVHGDDLAIAPDTMFSCFIEDPIVGDGAPILRAKVVDGIYHRYGHALQAGLVAGSARAWSGFAAHVADCLGRIGTDFTDTYGLDTSILHLWAADHGVTILPQTQNFVTKAGVAETWDTSGPPLRLTFQGEDIHALHMTGEIRFFNRWRYYARQPGHALREGTSFALVAGRLQPCEPSATLRDACEVHGLTVTSLEIEEQYEPYWHVAVTPHGIEVSATGNYRLRLVAPAGMTDLDLHATSLSGFPSPIRTIIAWDADHGQTIFESSDRLLTRLRGHLGIGGTLDVEMQALPGQRCRSLLTLSGASRRRA